MITVFEDFVPLDVDVREGVPEVEGDDQVLLETSSDPQTEDKLQIKILSYMSKLVERLEHIYIFCGQFRTKADPTLRIFGEASITVVYGTKRERYILLIF